MNHIEAGHPNEKRVEPCFRPIRLDSDSFVVFAQRQRRMTHGPRWFSNKSKAFARNPEFCLAPSLFPFLIHGIKTAVQKWGNSLAIRIPRAFAGEMRLGKGAEVNLHLKSGKLVVSSIAPRRPGLRSLLARVRKSNLHSEADWGGAGGKEIW